MEHAHAQAFRLWLTDLPADTPLPVLVRRATSRWEIETDYKVNALAADSS
ncbi:hypothetical protein [Streptomyces noursei]